MFDKLFGEVTIGENMRHSFQETDVSDGGFEPGSVGHGSSQYSPGIPVCGCEHRLLWKRFWNSSR